ncbi:hypothetical protein L8U00_01020, partial [Campylobacter sp. IFREMER_LSEM_CL2256]|uniref:hypothetical protein n=1 Tax=Campylobacter sp. IFREMER_LSEM_CL2256 TaxID=2911622 RepID=UPI0021E80637
MTAYVHIGTVKTGTTTIQQFLSSNDHLFLKKGYFYSKILRKNSIQHWNIISIMRFYFNIKKYSIFAEDFKQFKNEMDKHKHNIYIISTEGITWTFKSKETIVLFKKFMNDIGFVNIKIILYLRDTAKLLTSLASQEIKNGYKYNSYFLYPSDNPNFHTFDYKWLCESYSSVFGRENLIVRLFDQNEFYQGDLLKDFIHVIGLKWDENFAIPLKQNESLDLLGFEIQSRLNKCIFNKEMDNSIKRTVEKYLQDSNSKGLNFKPPKKTYQSYIDYFEESNEWVRKEFFPYKERLFPKEDLSNYKENYELKEMKPEYWDKIAEFIADIVKTKNQAIIDKEQIIQNQKNKIEILEQASGSLDK